MSKTDIFAKLEIFFFFSVIERASSLYLFFVMPDACPRLTG